MDIFIEKYGLDPYEVLGVDKTFPLDKIKRYYYKKALILHPDKTKGHTIKEFQILKEAYNSILNDFQTLELLTSLNKKKPIPKPTREIFPEKDKLNERQTGNYSHFLEDKIKFVAPKKISKYDSSLPENVNYANISMKDFHKTFEFYRQKYEEETGQLIEAKKVKPIKEEIDLDYSKVYVYNGILLTETDEEITKKNRKKYERNFGMRNPNQDQYLKDKETIEKFTPKKVIEKEVKASTYAPIDISYDNKYSDSAFDMTQLKEHKKYIEKSKEKVYNDPRVSNHLLDQAYQGALEGSCLQEKDLECLSSLAKKLKLLESRKF